MDELTNMKNRNETILDLKLQLSRNIYTALVLNSYSLKLRDVIKVKDFERIVAILKKYGAWQGTKEFFDSQPGFFIIVEESNCSILKPVVAIEFCRDFDGKKGCGSASCSKLHVCRHFVKGKCTFGPRCKKPHHFQNGETRKLLKNHFLDELNEEHVREFLCRHVQHLLEADGSASDLPKSLELCKYYNVATGCTREFCPFLHVCRFFAEQGNCKFGGQCIRKHDINNAHARILLHRYQMDSLNEEQVLTFLKLKADGREIQSQNMTNVNDPKVSVANGNQSIPIPGMNGRALSLPNALFGALQSGLQLLHEGLPRSHGNGHHAGNGVTHHAGNNVTRHVGQPSSNNIIVSTMEANDNISYLPSSPVVARRSSPTSNGGYMSTIITRSPTIGGHPPRSKSINISQHESLPCRPALDKPSPSCRSGLDKPSPRDPRITLSNSGHTTHKQMNNNGLTTHNSFHRADQFNGYRSSNQDLSGNNMKSGSLSIKGSSSVPQHHLMNGGHPPPNNSQYVSNSISNPPVGSGRPIFSSLLGNYHSEKNGTSNSPNMNSPNMTRRDPIGGARDPIGGSVGRTPFLQQLMSANKCRAHQPPHMFESIPERMFENGGTPHKNGYSKSLDEAAVRMLSDHFKQFKMDDSKSKNSIQEEDILSNTHEPDSFFSNPRFPPNQNSNGGSIHEYSSMAGSISSNSSSSTPRSSELNGPTNNNWDPLMSNIKSLGSHDDDDDLLMHYYRSQSLPNVNSPSGSNLDSDSMSSRSMSWPTSTCNCMRTELCLYHLRGGCHFDHSCSKLHTSDPYLWQIWSASVGHENSLRQVGSNLKKEKIDNGYSAYWMTLEKSENMRLELAYCSVELDHADIEIHGEMFTVCFDSMVAVSRQNSEFIPTTRSNDLSSWLLIDGKSMFSIYTLQFLILSIATQCSTKHLIELICSYTILFS